MAAGDKWWHFITPGLNFAAVFNKYFGGISDWIGSKYGSENNGDTETPYSENPYEWATNDWFNWNEEQATIRGADDIADGSAISQQDLWNLNNQLKMDELAYNRKVEFYENYESPDALVDQYRAAKINPALMFGGQIPSSSMGGSASSAPGSSGSDGSPLGPFQALLSGVTGIGNLANQTKQTKTNQRKADADIDLQNRIADVQLEMLKKQTEADLAVKAAEETKLYAEANDITRVDFEARETWKDRRHMSAEQLEQIKNQNNLLVAQVTNVNSQTIKNVAESEYLSTKRVLEAKQIAINFEYLSLEKKKVVVEKTLEVIRTVQTARVQNNQIKKLKEETRRIAQENDDAAWQWVENGMKDVSSTALVALGIALAATGMPMVGVPVAAAGAAGVARNRR